MLEVPSTVMRDDDDKEEEDNDKDEDEEVMTVLTDLVYYKNHH